MKKYFIFVFVFCLLFGVGLVGASHGGLPNVGWNSGQQIQNIGSASTVVQLVAYNAFGDAYDCSSSNPTLNPGESFTYLWANEPCSYTDVYGTPQAIPAGFSGSGVVLSNQPLAGIVNINNLGFGKAAGQYNGTTIENIDTEISFPLVKYNHAGRTTTFYIQNASDSTNTMTATFYMGGTSYTITLTNVPPYARVILNPSDAITSPSATAGSLKVIGTQPMAGISLEHPTDTPITDDLNASRAFVPSDYENGAILHCPMLRHEFGGLNTTSGLQVQNLGNSDTNITVVYHIVYPSPSTISYTKTGIGSGASANFLQSEELPEDTLASGIITNSENYELAAVVNDRADEATPKRFLTYACFNSENATTRVSLPLVKEKFFGIYPNTSGVQVQNVGSIPTHVKLTYITNENNTYVVTTNVPINPGDSKTFYQLTTSGSTPNITITPTNLSLLVNTVSGVIVESQSWNGNKEQPIVAIAVESSMSTNSRPQDTKAYEGINLP